MGYTIVHYSITLAKKKPYWLIWMFCLSRESTTVKCCIFSVLEKSWYKKHVSQLELLVSKTLCVCMIRSWMWRLAVDVWWLLVRCCAPSSQSLNGSPHYFHASQCQCRRPSTSRWRTDHANHHRKRVKRMRRMETGTAQGKSQDTEQPNSPINKCWKILLCHIWNRLSSVEYCVYGSLWILTQSTALKS